MSDHYSQETIFAYLDQELTAAERERLQQHLESCQACQQELQQARALFARIEAVPEMQLSRDLAPSVVDRIEAEPDQQWQLPWWLALEGLAALLVLGFWLIRYPTRMAGSLDQLNFLMILGRWILPRAKDLWGGLAVVPDRIASWLALADPMRVLSLEPGLPWAPIMLALLLLWLLANGLLLSERSQRVYSGGSMETRKGSDHG